MDFEILARFDPTGKEPTIMESREVEKEVRAEMERDAALLKARAKLDQHKGSAAPYFLNPG